MNLFLNALQEDGIIILFNNNREIIHKKEIKVLGNESSKLVGVLDKFLDEVGVSYNKLENLVVVNGPGSFTGIRTIVLMINTINFVINKNITTLSYFDLFNNYPIVKPSSKRDCFLKINSESNIEIISNDNLKSYFEKNKIVNVFGDLNTDLFGDIKKLDIIDYKSIIQNIKFDNKKQIEPLYIKKPNIS